MRRSAKVLLSAGGVLVLTAAGLAWLVATPSGQQMLLRTALPLVPGLKAGSIEGGFFDLTITDLSYEMPGLTAGADRITLRLDRDALLSERRIAVTKLEILHPHGVLDSASLPPSDPSAPSADTGPVTMPWPVSLDNAEITSLDFTADGTKVTLAYFGASASWIGEALSVKPLRIRSLAVALPGSEKTAEERAEEDRKVAERRAAEIKAKFEARKPVITFDATALNKMFADLFSKPLLTELPEVSLPFSLDVSEFEATNLKLAGASPVVIDELRLDASMKASEVEIRRLDLKMPEATGSLKGRARLSGKWPLDLRANTRLSVAPVRGEKADVTLVGEVMGKVSLAAVAEGPVPAKFLLAADPATAGLPFSVTLVSPSLKLPLEGANPADLISLSAFSLRMSGDVRNWKLDAGLGVKAPGTPSATAGLKGRGTLTSLTLDELTAKTAGGTGRVTGEITWVDALRWRGDMKLANLDVSHFAPSVKAVLSGSSRTSGRIDKKGWSVELPEFDVKGRIDNAALDVHGSAIAQSPMKVYVPDVSVSLDANKLTGRAMLDGKNIKADIKVDAPDLGRNMKELAGSASGFVTIGGTLSEPVAKADLTATGLRYGDAVRLEALMLRGDISAKPSGEVGGSMMLYASNGALSESLVLHDIVARLEGTDRKHELTVNLSGEPVNAELKLAGAFDTKSLVWKGTLSNGTVSTPIGSWHQDKAAGLVYKASSSEAVLEPHCWVGKPGDVCIDDKLRAGEKGSATLRLRKWELDVLKPWLPPLTTVAGTVNGTAKAKWDLSSGSLPEIDALVDAGGMTVTQTTGEEPLVVHLDTVSLKARTDKSRASAELDVKIRDNADLKATVAVIDPAETRRLDGRILFNGGDLSIVNTLIGSDEKVEGRLNVDVALSGTLLKPLLNGGIALTDARVSEGAVPLVMKPSNIRIDFAGDTSTLEGRLETSQGALDLAGDAQWRDMAHPTANVHASGSDILITVPPYAKVTVSPDVSLAASSERVTLNGRIEVPAAQITVADLPATATGVSSDEVLLDRHMKPKVSKTATIPIDSNIVVHMGDQIFIDAFGLKAKLSGDLKVTQDARRGLGLNGQVNVDDGRFHAYGQDLIVRTGHVIFAGAPSRPQLNIEAIRNPEAIEDDVTAGIRVTGNAMRPKVTVFSEPALSQQQALSYLLRGQGLDTSSDDNSMITSALVGLGVSQTGRIIGEIGDAVGIKDLGVDTAGVGESSQVVVSGYILPGLQLKYGVGIFDSLATITLRYRLMPRLYLEAASGVNQAFDVLYSFEY